MKQRSRFVRIVTVSALLIITAVVGGFHLWLNSVPVTVCILPPEVCGEPTDLSATPHAS